MGIFKLLKSKRRERLVKKKRKMSLTFNINSMKDIKRIDRIDKKIRRLDNARLWGRKKKKGHYGVHREHGWYLPNDD